MERPELLLRKLNASLRDLYAAIRILDAPELDRDLVPVMRRLLLAEVLGDVSVVAVGGSQGAGKTTLVRTMYGADSGIAQWLQPNEGRGECMPILVMEEAGRKQAQGAMWTLEEVGVGMYQTALINIDEPAQFHNSVVSPGKQQLLPVLKVPARYFSDERQAWLLLPGYEAEDAKNRDWQHLMRQGLVGAAGSIIVTDETRLAMQEQSRIVDDMRENDLQGAQLLVVISKTEPLRHSPESLQALRDSARATFKVPPQRSDDWLVCAGSDDSTYVEQWLPLLSKGARDLARSGGTDRLVRQARLAEVIRHDLGNIIATINMKAMLHFNSQQAGEGQEVVESCLEAFDDRAADLRDEYQKGVTGMLSEHYSTAWARLQTLMERNHEGVIENIKDYFRKATPSWLRVEQDILSAWNAPGPVLETYATVLGKITHAQLGGPAAAKVTDAAPKLLTEGTPVQRLGYAVGDRALEWKRPDHEDVTNLTVLFNPPVEGSSEAPPASRTNAQLAGSIKLLPSLSLEYLRLGSLFPQILGVDPKTDLPADALRRPDLIMKGFADLGKGVEAGKTLRRTIAAVLAVDAIDGSLDIAHAAASMATGGAASAGTVAGGAATAGAVSIGAVVVGAVAVGYLVHTAIGDSRAHDEKARDLFQAMLQNVRDHYHLHFMDSYDDLMKQTRARLSDALRQRYRLDEALVRKDHLAKSLADTKAYSHDFLEHLAWSGATTVQRAAAARA